MQERHERLAGRAPVQALERAVVEQAVDPPHLLVEDGVERTALGQDLAHDAVAALVQRREMPRAAQPVDEVPLPVAHAGAVLHRLRALVDVHPPRNLAASGVTDNA